jgi:cyclohexanone monooxygenase
MREHGKKRIDVVKEVETKWNEQVKGIAGHTLLPKAESWQFGCNVPGAVREPLFFLGGVGTYMGILEDVKRKAYEGFVLS